MKRIAPGDLVAVRANGRYYYALILDKIKLFGGNWSYVFHATTDEMAVASKEILGDEKPGFHAFVDFIWAKRESRLQEVKQVAELTEEEKSYPFPVRIDDTRMVQRIDQKWKPSMDERI